MPKNVADYSEVFNQIKALKKNLEKAVADSINEGAAFAAKEVEKRTPVDDSRKGDRIHAKDHVIYSKATKNNPTAEVGFDKEVAWRMHFVEFGTIKQKPQPFVQRTIEDIQNDIQTIIANKLKEVIK